MKRTMIAMAMGAAMILSSTAMAKPPPKLKKSMATPNLTAAKSALKQAKGKCQAAQTSHKDHGGLGGHAAKCQELVEQAIKEVDEAMEIAKGGGAGSGSAHEAAEKREAGSGSAK